MPKLETLILAVSIPSPSSIFSYVILLLSMYTTLVSFPLQVTSAPDSPRPDSPP